MSAYDPRETFHIIYYYCTSENQGRILKDIKQSSSSINAYYLY